MLREIKMLIPIEEDEMLISWIKTIGMFHEDDLSYFFNEFLDLSWRNGRFRNDYLPNLANICEINKESNLFPGVLDAMRYHTPYYTLLPFCNRGLNARRSETLLRYGTSMRMLPKQTIKEFDINYVCPVCVEEDKQKYGREILHVRHHLPGVTCCYKHRVKLVAVDEYNSSKPTIAATDNEIKVADFMNSLFESPLYTDLENTMDLLKEQGELKSQYYHASTEEIIQIVAEKFTYEEFSSLVKQYHSLDDIGPINPTYIAVSDFGPLMKFHCLTCEKDFYADPYSLKIGTLCPACAAKMSDMDLLARYVSLHGDEKYKLLSISDHNTMEVLHEPCGVITHPNIQQFIWNDSKCHFCARVSNDEWQKRIDPDVKEFKILSRKVSSGIGRLIVDHINSGHAPFEIADDKMLDRPHCPLCESSGGNLRNYTEEDGIIRFTSNSIESNIVKEARAKHVGQANYASNGQRMEIIEYHNSKDVTVQFEDGTIRSGIALAAFMRGKVKNPNKLVETKKDRTGEEMVSRAGQKMVIVEYRKSSDIDVKFEDGTVVEHQRYPNFLSGDIINPSVEYKGNRLTERLGEIGIMKNGQSCKIVVYYSSKNMDVEFEDGTIAHNVYYSDFKRGNVKNPSTDRIINRRKKDVVGETNVAKNGMLITIIAAPDQNDLTIQFEDGFIAEHVSWKRFKAGSVLRPDCNYH